MYAVLIENKYTHTHTHTRARGDMTSPAADKSRTKSPGKSPGLLSRLNCASGKSGKTQAAPLTMSPATPLDMSRSYDEDPGY